MVTNALIWMLGLCVVLGTRGGTRDDGGAAGGAEPSAEVVTQSDPGATADSPREFPALSPDLPIVFDKYQVDVGEIGDDKDLTYAFKFTNLSTKTVKVELLNFCHHCGEPEITPSVVRPGESGAVIVDLHVAGKRDRIQASVTVGVVGMPGKEIPLILTAIVAPKVQFTPRRQGFGEVRIGEGGVVEVKLIARAPAVTITGLRCDSQFFTVTSGQGVSTNTNGNEQTVIPIRIQLVPNAPAGWQKAVVIAETSIGVPSSVEVTADVLPTLRVEPPDVGRGSVSIGQDLKRTFAVFSRDAEPVVIEGLSIGYAGPDADGMRGGRTIPALADVQLTTAIQADGHKVAVDIAIKAPMTPGRYLFQVRLMGSRGQEDTLVVPIHFEVTPD